jgi:hypothetical protein
VTFFTGSWKLCNVVIGIFGRSVIGSVASRTSGWRIGINITLMAIYTAMRGGFMGSIKHKVFIVIRKCSGAPPRCGGMTLRAIGRETKGLVVWVDTTVVILGMTARTSSGSISEITGLVAFFTIIGNDLVCPRQRVVFAMVKGGGAPTLGGMTSFASLRQLGIYVIGILRSFEVSAVATRTRIGRSGIIPIDVASRTVVFYCQVRPGQRIILIVIKRRRTPSLLAVTAFTVGR